MKERSKYTGMVGIVLCFLFFFGCEPGTDQEIAAIGDVREGDIQTETYIVDGEEYTSTYKVYDLANADQEPVLVILPLDSGDRIVNEIDNFMDQTTTSAAEIKAYSEKYYFSVDEFVNFAKGVSSYDDLDEFDWILNKYQHEFGEDGVFTLYLMLEEMDLSLKEFISTGEEVFGDEYIDWIKEKHKTLDQLYTDYILSEKETYKDFLEDDGTLEDGGTRLALATEILGSIMVQAIFDIVKSSNAISVALLENKTVSLIHETDAKDIMKLAPEYRAAKIFNSYYGMKTGSVPSGYAATGISYYFNVDYSYQAKSRKDLPGIYWVPQIKIYSTSVNAVGLCPFYAYYVPWVKVVYGKPRNISPTPGKILPELKFKIVVNCYMRIGLCIGKVAKNRTFSYKISGKDGYSFLGRSP